MNKRFEDLMYHAGLTAQGCWDELGTYEQEAMEKFAELIVRECMTNLYLNGYDDAVAQIQKHFGVEE